MPAPRPAPVLPSSPDHDRWMDVALEEARAATLHGDVPIGAVVVQVDGAGAPRILTRRHNERELTHDGTAHGEVLALRDACAELGRWRLDDCLMVVTLEPCPMCAGALWATRIGGVVIGTESMDSGSLGTLYHLGQDPRLNHEFPVRVGVRRDESAALLQEFFAARR
jgi:tRNA(adenine34) deaminase